MKDRIEAMTRRVQREYDRAERFWRDKCGPEKYEIECKTAQYAWSWEASCTGRCKD